ncbi:MAG: zinc metalloprotease HtpX [Cyanobacteria bacterium P01_H01_bin.26]
MGLDRSPEQLIKVGLAALKQKDYGRAIAAFQTLHQADNIETSHRLKAQMGLIRAYEAQGAHARARDLCKPLLKTRSQAIRQWASEKLQQLGTEAATPSPQQPTHKKTQTGFVPAVSGFIPFGSSDEPSATEGKTALPNTAAATTESSQTAAVDGAPSSLGSSPDSPVETISSLFHYQTLNSSRKLNPDKEALVPPPVKPHSPRQTSHPPAPGGAPPKEPSPVPPAVQQKSSSQATSFEDPEIWPQGSRLRALKSLGKVSSGRLWFAQLATIPILFIVLRWLVQSVLGIIRNYLQFLEELLPINFRLANFFWATHTWTVIIGLGLLTIASPWLWSLLLHPTTDLTSQQLQTHSPEASRLLQRFCSKRRWPLPKIQLLTSQLPLIFSYGWRPRYGRLVVSQGLLEQLAPDELAAVILYEMGHWSTLDWIFFSTHGLLLQTCHRAYWLFARWGEDSPIFIKIAAGTLASLSYGVFWLLTKVGCGLARTRTPYRDRTTAELTGNPNGLARALAKLSTAMTNAVAQQGYTPPLLESLDLMLPVGPGAAGPSIQQFTWGAFNPLRHWLSLNQGHPPLGDRLYTLSAYACHWRLKPSLDFTKLRLQTGTRTTHDWPNLLLQGGAWSGAAMGLAAVAVMWLIGAIATNLDFPLLAWLYKDRSILLSMPLIGAATGQLIRINRFFPETTAPSFDETQLGKWQTDSTRTPLSSVPIKISGTLTGRPALANWLGQEWRLYTSHGSIKLHHTGYLGPLSNLRGPAPWLHQPLQVTGWLRRGHHIWIDIDRLRTRQNQVIVSQHPVWSVTTSLLLLSYGLWLLFQG